MVPSDPDPSGSVRPLEASIRTDLGGAMTYAAYLDLHHLLAAQHPRSSPEHHDELLFIVQHQTSELWLKLVLHELLEELLRAPTLYDEFLRLLARLGLAVPAAVLERGVRRPWTFAPDLVPVFREVYESTGTPWGVYEPCESLVDVEDNWQLWRFRHLRTVQGTIGAKTGIGGSSGAGFLRRALDRTFLPGAVRRPHRHRHRGRGIPAGVRRRAVLTVPARRRPAKTGGVVRHVPGSVLVSRGEQGAHPPRRGAA